MKNLRHIPFCLLIFLLPIASHAQPGIIQVNEDYPFEIVGTYTATEVSRIFESQVSAMRSVFHEAFGTQGNRFPRQISKYGPDKPVYWNIQFSIPFKGFHGTQQQLVSYMEQNIQLYRQSLKRETLDHMARSGFMVSYFPIPDDEYIVEFNRDIVWEYKGYHSADSIAGQLDARVWQELQTFQKNFGVNLQFSPRTVFFSATGGQLRHYRYTIPLKGVKVPLPEAATLLSQQLSKLRNHVYFEWMREDIRQNPYANWGNIQPTAATPSNTLVSEGDQKGALLYESLDYQKRRIEGSVVQSSSSSELMKRAQGCVSKYPISSIVAESEKNSFSFMDCMVGEDTLEFAATLSEFCKNVEASIKTACFLLTVENFGNFDIPDFMDPEKDIEFYKQVASRIEIYFADNSHGKRMLASLQSSFEDYECIRDKKTVIGAFSCVETPTVSVREEKMLAVSACLAEAHSGMGRWQCLSTAGLGKEERKLHNFVDCYAGATNTRQKSLCVAPAALGALERSALKTGMCLSTVTTPAARKACFVEMDISTFDSDALTYAKCLASEDSLQAQLNCVAPGHLGGKEQQALKFAKCLADSTTHADRANCLAVGNFGEKEREALALAGCVTSAENHLQRLNCVTEGKLGDKEQDILNRVNCAYGSASYVGMATCAIDMQLTDEQKFMLDCMPAASTGPQSYAACVGGNLIKKEAQICLQQGYTGATSGGCIGKNNTYRVTIENIRREFCSIVGDDNQLCQGLSFVIDNSILPGKNHEVVKYFNTAIHDINNGPGPNNEFRKAARTAEKMVQDAGSEAEKLLQDTSKAADDFLRQASSTVGNALPKIIIGAPKKKPNLGRTVVSSREIRVMGVGVKW